jgi:hypothetical protein
VKEKLEITISKVKEELLEAEVVEVEEVDSQKELGNKRKELMMNIQFMLVSILYFFIIFYRKFKLEYY